jgi:hypothetical protein
MDIYGSFGDNTDVDEDDSFGDNTDMDEDYSDDDIEFCYEAEELSQTKYNLVLCERYNKQLHGISTDEINYHYLTYLRFKKFDINVVETLNPSQQIHLEIAECIYLPSQHCVSILKTFWIRLIQRVWKKIYKDRLIITRHRCSPNSIKYREIYGKWPSNCINYPTLKGMLYNLSMTCSGSSS